MNNKDMHLEGIKGLTEEYFALRKMKSDTEKRMKEVANSLKEFAMSNGVKDSNGSAYYETEKFVFGSQAKKSVKLNEEKAKDYLLALGLYEKVVETKEYINEDKLEQLMMNGEILPEDLEAMVDIKTSYAIDIKEKKEEVEEEMPTVEVANSVKPKKLPKKLSKK